VSERGEPFPAGRLERDVEALVKGVATVLDDPWSYRSFLGQGENQQIGRSIAEKHVQAGGSLASALEAYMRLRQAMILASRDVFRESDRPFFDLMTRLNRCIDRVLFAIAEGYFSAFQAEIEKQAVTDALTGLGNSRRFREALASELKRSDRSGRPFSIVFVDVDDFKDINDRIGHVQADYTLAAIGRALEQELRGSDLVCRWGGDEFIILLPEAERSAAGTLAERLRAAVANCEKCAGATISLGLACYPTDGKDYDSLVANADRALYASKHRGKNVVTQSTEG
jgi:diguanylate cyclase (GGDEF)-like protein